MGSTANATDTLEEVGEKFGRRERIRQIQAKALPRLALEWPNVSGGSSTDDLVAPPSTPLAAVPPRGRPTLNRAVEPPRLCRRLRPLRGRSRGQTDEVPQGGPGAGRASRALRIEAAAVVTAAAQLDELDVDHPQHYLPPAPVAGVPQSGNRIDGKGLVGVVFPRAPESSPLCST